jgi:hypothetical protein
MVVGAGSAAGAVVVDWIGGKRTLSPASAMELTATERAT